VWFANKYWNQKEVTLIKMKTIVLFYDSVFPVNNAGSIRAYHLLKALSKYDKELDLIVLTGTDNPIPQSGVRFLPLNNVKSYEKISVLKRLYKEFRLGVASVIALRKLGEIDFVFISSPSYLASLILSGYIIFKNKKFFFEVRDLYPEAYVYAGLIKKNSFIYNALSSLTKKIYSASLLNVSATSGINGVISSYVQSDKNVIMYNGFPRKFLELNENKFEKFTVVFHGTLGFFQDIELLIELANKIEPLNIDLIVIGHGVKSDAIINASNKLINLKFKASLSHEDTISIVSMCHVGISLRLNDPLSQISFPVKNWEYLGLGIPSVLTPKGSEAGVFLEKNQCGIQVNEGDLASLVSSVVELRDNAHLYKMLVDGCLNVRKLYTRENLCEQLAARVLSLGNKL